MNTTMDDIVAIAKAQSAAYSTAYQTGYAEGYRAALDLASKLVAEHLCLLVEALRAQGRTP